MRVGVSGLVTAASGVGVIQRRVYPELARQHELVHSPTREPLEQRFPGQGFLRGLQPPQRSLDAYLAVVSPLPLLPPQPLVTVVHDLRWLTEAGRAKRAYRAADLRRVAKRSSLIVCVSETTRRDFLEVHPEAESRTRAAWLGPGILDDETDAWHEGEPGQVLLIGKAARKRNDLAVEVLRHLPAGRISRVTGVGVAPEVRARAEEVFGADACTWHSNISDDALVEVYRQAELYVHLGTQEGFGLPFVEALRTGTTVVAIDQPLSREVLGDSAILLEDGPAQSLARQWAECDAPDRTAARERAGRFTWSSFVSVVRHGLESV